MLHFVEQKPIYGIQYSIKTVEADMKKCKNVSGAVTGAAVCFSAGVLLSFFLPYYVMIITLSVLILVICIFNIL